MRASFKYFSVFASLIALVAVSTSPAFAKCTRLAYSVNDYGKVGPTNDAKQLLDKYIAEWTAKRGITRYRTGPKSVKCELFIDLIVFDEYTCRAEATVCWGGNSPAGARSSRSSGNPGSGSGDDKAEMKKPEPSAAEASNAADSRYVTSE